jgi:hypothetical protein
MRRTLIAGTALFALAAGGLAACGSGDDASSTTSSTVAGSTSSTLPPDEVVGAQTEWVDETDRWRAVAPEPFDAGPEVVADDLAALLRGGDTSETGLVEVAAVETGEPLVVVLRETGLADDSVSGADHEITLEASEGGWVVVGARVQYSCYRGVDETDATLCV